MKVNVLVVALVVFMATNAARAQDTLRINSLRVVDLCSGEKSWLMTLSLGRINFSDSLESFDIAIGYERGVLRPTSVLKEGTLSAQFSNGPVMNTVTPNEMRIYGFNIARSVAGDLPLFAVSGDFLGTCSDIGRFTIPIAADFNGEFKRRYEVSVLDSVVSVARKKTDSQYGVAFARELDTISDISEATSIRLRLKGFESSKVTQNIRVGLLTSQDSNSVTFGQASCIGCSLKSSEVSATSASILIDGPFVDTSSVVLKIQRRSAESVGTVRLISSVDETEDCSCRKAGLSDTSSVIVLRPNVNVKPSTDDGTCTLDAGNGIVRGVCHHLQTKSLEMFDLHGRSVQNVESTNGDVSLSTAELVTGMYFVVFQCNTVRTLKLIVK